MEDFILLFRLDIITEEKQPGPELLKEYMKQYHDWVGGIAAQNRFLGGKGLSVEGKVLGFDDVVTDGPYVDIKESIAGYIMIRAKDFDDAVRLAKPCPMLKGKGNTVEIRKIVTVHEREQAQQ